MRTAKSDTLSFRDIKLNVPLPSIVGTYQGWFYGEPGGGRPPMKNVAPQWPLPHFGPASLDFHLNTPVISLIQLHIVPPAGIVAPSIAPPSS